MEAVGPFSAAQCTLEMYQMDKREAAHRMCQNLGNVYAQLQVAQHSEQRWLQVARHSQAGLQGQLNGLQGQDAKLQRELSFAQRAFSQNEKLELSLEELQELYRHNHQKDQQDAAEVQLLRKKYAVAANEAASDKVIAKRLEKREVQEAHDNGALRQTLLAERSKLRALREHDVADLKAVRADLAKARLDAAGRKGEQKSLALVRRSSSVIGKRLALTVAENKALRTQLVQAKAAAETWRQQATEAEARAAVQLRDLQSALAKLEREAARGKALEAKMGHVKQQAALACEAKVHQALEECNSRI